MRDSRISREKFKTIKDVFDLFTEKHIFKLMSQGYFEGLIGPLSMGKEAAVFTAETKEKDQVVVKVYRLSTCDYNKMYENLRTDPRFPHTLNKRRKIVFAWAQREYRNLLLAREAGCRVPTAIACIFNILVMEFIGNDSASQKLKDDPPENPGAFFKEIVKQMKLLHKAGLVHGDLSPFNILNHDQKPVFIDLSQATSLEDPNAQKYLERDIRNICNYFRKLGVKVEEESVRKELYEP